MLLPRLKYWSKRLRWWIPLAAAVTVGIAASLSAFFLIHDVETGRARAAFEQVADERLDQLQERIRKVLADARSIAMLFSSSVHVTREEFETFVSPILTDEPGLVGAFWFPRVTAADRPTFEQQAKSEGLSDFAVRQWGSGTPLPVSERDLHFPLYYACPRASFGNQVGWDLFTDPVRADAVRRAIGAGQMSASAPLSLSGGSRGFGYLVLIPLLGYDFTQPVGAYSWDSVVSLVGALLDVSQVIGRSPLGVASPSVQLVLRDPNVEGGPVLLWSMHADQPKAEPGFVGSVEKDAALTRPIALADRRLEAVATPSVLFSRQHRPWVSWLVLSLGVAGTVLFGSYGVFLRGRVVAARRHSAEMQVLLARLEEEMKARLHAEERLRASEKMEAIGRLAGGIAHDFNNLLQVILGNTELLLMRKEGHSEERPAGAQSEELGEIKKAAQLAAGLTHKLLTFARPDSGEAQVLSIDQQIAEMMPLFERTTADNVLVSFYPWSGVGAQREAGGTIRHPHLASNLPWTPCPEWRPLVNIDPLQLQQVLLNLVINAAESMPDGGEVTIATSAVVVDGEQANLHAEVVPGSYAVFEVTDTGQGMDAETLSHIFEPFFTTKKHGHGTGLGLATVYGIVKRAGGYIEVESEVGRGSTFRIYLPLAVVEAPQSNSRGDSGGVGSMESKATILVVEDNEAVRRLAVRILTGAGYVVWEAADGPEALSLVEKSPRSPDVLLTDLSMPGMSGQELAARVCELVPELPVIFISGYADDAIADGPFAGRAVFVHKPFTPAALLGRLQEILADNDS